jgi:hypothetical protein
VHVYLVSVYELLFFIFVMPEACPRLRLGVCDRACLLQAGIQNLSKRLDKQIEEQQKGLFR